MIQLFHLRQILLPRILEDPLGLLLLRVILYYELKEICVSTLNPERFLFITLTNLILLLIVVSLVYLTNQREVLPPPF